MPRGGARPGSGRPKGTVGIKQQATISKEQAREALREIVLKHMDDLVSAQVAHAKGLKYLVARDKDTGKFAKITKDQYDALLTGEGDAFVGLEVWEKDPSTQAFTDLMNRTLDKPKEQVQELQVSGSIDLVTGKLHSARARLAHRKP